ncbi:hypothetical protein LZ554_004930 [Drepanopeziza brunnea f. sp. 'monogermtubi']|nr:hypothetical protein LZ554_004930 [Drepanopeziza brunnea f. sp. 'monogermtubi']
MPSQDIEMTSSSSPEMNDVDMEDVRSDSSAPAEAEKPDENHVTSNGHLISEQHSESSGKSDDGHLTTEQHEESSGKSDDGHLITEQHEESSGKSDDGHLITEQHEESSGKSDDSHLTSEQHEESSGKSDDGHLTSEQHEESSGKSDKEVAVEGENKMDVDAIKIAETHVPPSSVSPIVTSSSHLLPSVEKDGTGAPSTADDQKTNSHTIQTKVDRAVLPPSKTPLKLSEKPVPSASETIKIDKEVARLKEFLAEVSSAAAQRVLKESWRMFLFDNYNEDHIAFILRAGLRNANATIIERVLRDEGLFKTQMMDLIIKRPDFLEKALQSASAALVTTQVPETVIDQVIVGRLETVPGKKLIQWLAQAQRLGYKADDIFDEDEESVTPNVPLPPMRERPLDAPPMANGSHYMSRPPPENANSYKDPLLLEQERNASVNKLQSQHVQAAIARNAASANSHRPGTVVRDANVVRNPTSAGEHAPAPVVLSGQMMCRACNRTFVAHSGFAYHVTKKVCDKKSPPGGFKWNCANCLSGFTTKQGMDYHALRYVCYAVEEIAPAKTSLKLTNGSSISTTSLPPPMPLQNAPTFPPPRPQIYTTQAPPTSAPRSVPPNSQPIPQGFIGNQKPPGTQPRPPVAIPRPPPPPAPSTPQKLKAEDEIRMSPDELSPQKRAEMEKALQETQDRTDAAIANLPASYTEAERASRTSSMLNANASKRSQIRKSFGVSLRLRKGQQAARVAAGLPVATGTKMPGTKLRESFGAASTHGPLAGAPSGTSFSPINKPSSNSSPPNNGYSPALPPPQSYNALPNHAPYGPRNIHQEDGLLTHINNNSVPPPDSGIHRYNVPIPVTSTNYRPQSSSNNPNKRKRDSVSTSASGTPAPGLSMVEVSSEDAAAKFANNKKSRTATPMADALGVPPGSGAKSSVIEILSDSSDSEDIELPIKSVEADEDEEGDGGDGPSSSRLAGRPSGFMARRGGKY